MAVLAIVLAFLLLAGAAVLMLRDIAARNLEQRVMSLVGGGQDKVAREANSLLGTLRQMLRWIGETVRGRTRFYSERDILVLEGMIAGSGLSPRNVLPIVLGVKAILAVGTPVAAVVYGRVAGLSGTEQFLALCIAIPAGLLGPDWALTLLRRPYLAALRRGVPDALDLLVVCTEAGMGLENALEHVSHEIRQLESSDRGGADQTAG